MLVQYKTNTLRKICTNATVARKKYGDIMARLIHQRVDEMSAAESIEQMIRFRIGRCHALHGNREGQFAVDLEQPHRLIFEKVLDEIKIVSVIEIVDDYH